VKVFRLRWRLSKQGLVLLAEDDYWIVTNNSPGKRGIYHEFKCLADVEVWLKMLEDSKKQE